MPTGEPGRARGFTYLWLLFLLAIGGALLAQAGSRWSLRLQRERELDLVARGREIATAIASYRAVPGIEPPQWPTRWEDLLEDRRGPAPRRHLRRAWTDPFTGAPDWEPVLAEGRGWRGVRSRAGVPALLVLEDDPPHEGAHAPRVSDHLFLAAERAPPGAAPASAPE